MPIIKSAIKKLRADKKRQQVNKAIKSKAINLISIFRKEKKAEGEVVAVGALAALDVVAGDSDVVGGCAPAEIDAAAADRVRGQRADVLASAGFASRVVDRHRVLAA